MLHPADKEKGEGALMEGDEVAAALQAGKTQVSKTAGKV